MLARGLNRQPFPVPYGLFIALAAYSLLALGYVWQCYWNSAEYQAAEHFAQASALLGLDDGRAASKEALLVAYTHYLEAARLVPREKLLHERVEAMRWRFDARGFKLDHDMQMRAEAVAMLWQRIQQQEDPLLVVGARDRAWAPAQLLAGPTNTLLFALPGALCIVVVWGYLSFSGMRVRAQQHEQELKALEAEVAARGAQRRKPAPPG
jgi:hypothetical protein